MVTEDFKYDGFDQDFFNLIETIVNHTKKYDFRHLRILLDWFHHHKAFDGASDLAVEILLRCTDCEGKIFNNFIQNKERLYDMLVFLEKRGLSEERILSERIVDKPKEQSMEDFIKKTPFSYEKVNFKRLAFEIAVLPFQDQRTIYTQLYDNEIGGVLNFEDEEDEEDEGDEKIGPPHADAIYQVLKRNDKIRVIKLNNNPILDVGAFYLSFGLRHCKFLQELHLQNAGITDKGAQALLKEIRPDSHLTFIDLQENKINVELRKEIIKKTTANQHNLDQYPVERLINRLLSQEPGLQVTIDTVPNQQTYLQIAGYLADNTSVTSVSLMYYRLSVESLLSLNLPIKTELQVLDLSNSNLDDNVVDFFSKTIQSQWDHLKILCLNATKMTDQHLIQLLTAFSVKENSQIEILQLGLNNIETLPHSLLSQVFRNCQNLRYINLKGNQLKRDTLTEDQLAFIDQHQDKLWLSLPLASKERPYIRASTLWCDGKCLKLSLFADCPVSIAPGTFLNVLRDKLAKSGITTDRMDSMKYHCSTAEVFYIFFDMPEIVPNIWQDDPENYQRLLDLVAQNLSLRL